MAFTQSVLVSAVALVGVVSFSAVSTTALLLVWELLRTSVPIDHRELRGSLGRFYWTSLSPLVHSPLRQFGLRAGIALVIVIARVIPPSW